MSIRKHITYDYKENEEVFPIPFTFEEDTDKLHIQGDKAILAALVQDDYPEDPLAVFEEGEFYQFNSRNVHYEPRPDVDEFKRIVRQNPGRVVLIYSRSGDYGYFPDSTAFDIHDTKTDRILEIEDADGYYIAPEDVTDPAKYAKGVMAEYSAWCTGDVWGIVYWSYDRTVDGEWELDEETRDECWGFYGGKYAQEEMEMGFKSMVEALNETNNQQKEQ